MKLYQNTSATSPTNTTDRIVDIDILRGFALFGIIVVNIFNFGVSHAFYTRYFVDTFTDVFNHGIYHSVNFVFTGKFYPIFSFLFGLGFFIQFSKLRQKGVSARSFFIRRLTLLLLFGVLHILFVWEGDILFFYALFGFVLIFLADQSPKAILITAGFIYALFICAEVLIAAHLIQPEYYPFNSMAGYRAFYTTASYWQILQARIIEYAGKSFTPGAFVDHFDRLAFFLVGLYAGKKNLIADISVRKSHWAYWGIAAFVFGILFQVIFWDNGLESSKNISLILVSRIMTNLFIVAQVFTYIVGFLLLLNIKIFKKWLQILAAPGRMTLTNYLMHTTAFSFLFYSYGFGLYASLSPLQLFTISILLFTFQIVFSNIWLRYFSYGPLEWVWRSFTYKKRLPMNKPLVYPSKSVLTDEQESVLIQPRSE